MKIRTDFVTNSSSVSYILTMHKEMVDTQISFWGESYGKLNLKVAAHLRDLMQKEGTRCMLEGEDIYSKKITFRTDETLTKDTLDIPEEKLDFAKLDDDELWSFICGEYIMNGQVSSLRGFGATQVETY